jgi:hypothetical protein
MNCALVFESGTEAYKIRKNLNAYTTKAVAGSLKLSPS